MKAVEEMPKISVIIPYYNTPIAEFKVCLDSILNQSFKEFEIIIVNDGSKNEYRRLIEELCANDNRITIISQNNGGVSAARNNGIENARGEYIVFVDSDDYLKSTFFEEAYKIASETNADVLYSFVPVKRDNYEDCLSNEVFPYEYDKIDDSWLKKYTVGYLYKKGEFAFGRGPWARLIKANVVKTTPFKKGVPLGEDVLWNLDIIQKTSNRYMAQTIWYYYIDRENSVTKRYDPEILNKLFPFYEYLNSYLTDGVLPYKYYCQRLLRDLKRYPYSSNYGNIANTDAFIRKWRDFDITARRFPFDEMYRGKFSQSISYSDKVKLLLLKTRLLYPFWRIESWIRRLGK